MKIGSYVFVIADISGYTKFIRLNRTSIFTPNRLSRDLLESVIAASQFPLQISKLEGDAVFLYASIQDAEEAGVRDVVSQVIRFFDAFHLTSAVIQEKNKSCLCEACATVYKLQLKVVVHTGQGVEKKIRKFKELAGDDVIFIHRMLKNSVPEKEYILASDALMRFNPDFVQWNRRHHSEHLEGYGKHNFTLFLPDSAQKPRSISQVSKMQSFLNIIPFTFKSLRRRFLEQKNFSHLI